MNSEFQIGQKVSTPKGDGIIDKIKNDKISVRLADGTLETFPKEKISDNSDAG